MSSPAPRLTEIYRYPVKSMGGETLQEVVCTERGLAGDRWWAVTDQEGKFGSGKTTRRFRRMSGLLDLTSFTDSSGVKVRLEDGTLHAVEDPLLAERLTELIGRPVTLQAEDEVSHFDDQPLHLLTTASLRWMAALRPEDRIEARRFRPNLVLEAEGEERVESSWAGARLQIGEVLVEVVKQTERCVMTAMAQPGLERAPKVFSELARIDKCLGVYAKVLEPGVLRMGDRFRLVPD